MTGPIRVLVVDDSATARALVCGMLKQDPAFSVIGEASTGEAAVDAARRLRPSLITMDVHMPGMDGLEATRQIMATAPTPIVVVTSAGPHASIKLSLDATEAGALTMIAKPAGPALAGYEERRSAFTALLKAMADVKVVRRWPRRATPEATPEFQLRPPTKSAQIVAIAASTGGPAVLHNIFRKLPEQYSLPILVVQHIATGFVDGLAEWLGHDTKVKVKVAANGEALRKGTVYVAPENRHLGVRSGGTVLLSDAPEIGGFRPSATYLFRSIANVYGAQAAAVILTGMGRDGVDGLADVARSGGQVIAQDESSCVVYGMPREAVLAGVVDTVLPEAQIPAYLAEIRNRRTL